MPRLTDSKRVAQRPLLDAPHPLIANAVDREQACAPTHGDARWGSLSEVAKVRAGLVPSMFGGLSSRNHGRRCMISAALLVDPVAALQAQSSPAQYSRSKMEGRTWRADRRVALGAVLSTSAAKAAGWFALSVDSTTLSFACGTVAEAIQVSKNHRAQSRQSGAPPLTASALAPSRCWPAIRTSPLNAALVASRFVAAASARASTAALAPRACCASVLAASSCCAYRGYVGMSPRREERRWRGRVSAVAMSSARSPASCALSALSVSVALFAQRSAAAAARAAAASRNFTQRSQPEHCADLNYGTDEHLMQVRLR